MKNCTDMDASYTVDLYMGNTHVILMGGNFVSI